MNGGGRCWSRGGPLLPIADHSVSCEHLWDPLGEGAHKQPHAHLAQRYAPVVVQFGGPQDLGAESNVRISPVHLRRCATEDGLVGVDEEPLDGRRKGLDDAGFNVVWARGLAIGLGQRGP